MDNASNNYSMMREMGNYYRANWPDMSFNPRTAHIFCFSHVINIVTQRILEVLDSPGYDESPDEEAEEEEDEDEDKDEGDDEEGNEESDPDEDDEDKGDNNDDSASPSALVSGGVISKVCRLVRTIRASGLCQEALEKIIISGNSSGLWTDLNGNVVVIQPHQLILDIKTRWDSTYQMLIWVNELQQVCVSPLPCHGNLIMMWSCTVI